MVEPLRTCLFDSDPQSQAALRAHFEQIRNLNIVSEVSTWDELKEWLRHGHLDMVAIHLGDQPNHALAVVQRVADMAPSCGILGISPRSDPQSIIAAMRAGCSQFVTWPIDQGDLAAAVERIRSTRASDVRTTRRICVIGSSGGAGATTVACNLAMELSHLTHRRCGLVDLNLEFGDVCTSFDCNPTYTIADVCREGVEPDRLLLGKALHELPCNVSILARPHKLEEVSDVTPEGVETALRVMGTMFPFVVVDLPRASGFIPAAAVRGADRVLIVSQLGVPFIRNATRIYDCLLQMGAPEGVIEIVLNRCNAHYERITPDEVESHFGQPIFAMIPNDYRRVQSSLDLGHPIVADAPTSPARLAIQQLARKLASDATHPAGEEDRAVSGGFFSKLWSRPSKNRQSL